MQLTESRAWAERWTTRPLGLSMGHETIVLVEDGQCPSRHDDALRAQVDHALSASLNLSMATRRSSWWRTGSVLRATTRSGLTGDMLSY